MKNNILNDKGVSAVEFALIAPVMILMLFGSIEISQAVIIDRKVTLASSTIADLITQDSTLNCNTLKTAVTITKSVFSPYDTQAANAQIVVASVAMVGGTPKVEWSQIVNSSGTCETSTAIPENTVINIAGKDSNGNNINLANSMIPTNGSILLGDVTLAYTSLGTSFIQNGINLNERFYLRPRKSLKVCLSGKTTPGCP